MINQKLTDLGIPQPIQSVRIPLYVLPTLWFRNVWTWWPETPKPSLRAVITKNGVAGIAASDAELGDYFLYCEGKRRQPLGDRGEARLGFGGRPAPARVKSR